MAVWCTTLPAAMHHLCGSSAPFRRWRCTIIRGQAALLGRHMQWSNVLYERVYPGGDLLIQFVGRDAYKQFWNFSKDEKENLATQLAIELPALRGKVGASQEEIASAVGISRQTYSAYENRTRPIPWSLYLALLFYFDYIPSTHYMIRQLELFPNERSYGNKT